VSISDERVKALERRIERLTEERDGWKAHAEHLHKELEAVDRDLGHALALTAEDVQAELHAALAREATLRRQVEELEAAVADTRRTLDPSGGSTRA
jgi:uncharacterized protein YhaN